MEHVLIVLFRLSAMVAFLPVFGERTVPARVKLAIAVSLTLLVFPLVTPTSGLTMAAIFTEIATGAFFGILMRLMVIALQIAGSIAAQSTSLAQLFGGGASEPMPAIGHFLVVSGLALLALGDFHLRLIQSILMTYEIFPIGQFIGAVVLLDIGLSVITQTFSVGFSLAAPFVIASLLYNFMLGAINKAMPQLMVALVGAPAITFLGIILLFLAAPLMLESWLQTVVSVMTLETF